LFDIEAFHNVLINLSAFDRVSDEVIKRVRMLRPSALW